MGLAFAALRMCAVQALKGRTLAGSRVRDSEIGPVSAEDAAGPSIAVYTEDASFDAGGGLSGPATVTLLICPMVTSRARLSADGYGVEQPMVDQRMELLIDRMCRQILFALGDPTGPWADLLRRFARTIRLESNSRGSNDRDGVKFAGRELKFSVSLVREPTPGGELPEYWADLLQLCEDSGSTAIEHWGGLIASALAADPVDPATSEWAMLGLSEADVEALDLGDGETLTLAADVAPEAGP